MERAVLVCDGNVIHGQHLPPTLQTAKASDTVAHQSLAESVESFERDILQDALKTSRGSCARAARLLGTTERIFNYKVRKYGIDVKRFKPYGRHRTDPRPLARRPHVFGEETVKTHVAHVLGKLQVDNRAQGIVCPRGGEQPPIRRIPLTRGGNRGETAFILPILH